MIHIFHKYQKIIAGFFKDHEKDQKNRTGNDLLEICNRIVAGSLENREEYMKVRLTNLVQEIPHSFLKTGRELEISCETYRRISGKQSSDIICDGK